jgi:cyclase
MLRKRIIFTLIYDKGFFNQSRNFRLQRVGNLSWLEKNYKFQHISFSLDELIVLNAAKQEKNIEDFAKTLSLLRNNVFIPIAAGGGIRTIEDAELLFNNGADKIVLNTALFKNTDLVSKIIEQYGSQSVVASIDYKDVNGNSRVYIDDGQTPVDISLTDYLKYVEDLEVGEIYLNSIDKDGTGFGYNFEVIQKMAKNINVPLIIAGGAGNENHLIAGLQIPWVNAVATANLFNFVGDGLTIARKRIIELGENLAKWD